jgi:tetratricopeptide (TPR) repeat protein
VFLGFIVQVIGVSIDVDANEVKRIAAGIVAHNAWVFVPKASPVVYDLQDLVARRNLSPWAIRALAIPDMALLLLIVLVAIVLLGGWLIFQYFRTAEGEPANLNSRAFPIAIVVAAVVPILIGFAMARPINQTRGVHGYELLEAGLAEQRAGKVVSAEEDYALVLSLFPTNKFAWFDMGLMEQEAGRINEAILLYQDALREDPSFSPAKDNMEVIMRTHFGFPTLHR